MKPAFPQSETVPAKEAAAPKIEPAAEAPSSRNEPAAEVAAAPKVDPHANAVRAALAPVVQADELSVEPRKVKGHDRGTHPVGGSRAVSKGEAIQVSEAADESDALKGHDFSRAMCSQMTVGALAPEASFPTIDSEIPPDSEPPEPAAATPVQSAATTPPDQAAPPEEAAETIEIAAVASPQEVAAPEKETAPEPEASSNEEAISDPMEIPSHAFEPASPSEPIAAEAPSAPEPLPPREIAPTLPFAEKPERTTAEKVAAALKARGEDADQSPFSVLVNQVYDGPLDLLLDLIRKQDIDIYDIPIARITAQFLAYVDQLRAGDMDVAGDFIYTAALLIHIKSKMLLPRAPAGPDDDAEDPRRELVERLLEHERFKNAAQMLLEKQMLEYATWSNPGIREFQEDSAAEPEIAADTTDLVRVFSDILERARNRPIIDVEEDSVTVGQMIQFLARRLTMEDRPMALRRMLSHTRSERALIAMFLALLELVRLQAILLRQDRHFSEIFIKKHTGFDALMNQGLANARDDWR